MRSWKTCVLMGAMAGLAGCATYVAHKIEHPTPPGGNQMAFFRANLREQGFHFDTMQTPAGVRIAYWIGEPATYDFRETFTAAPEVHGYHLTADLPAKAPVAWSSPVKGTVVLLHPWEGEGAMMVNWAYHFASSGYVVVMPDLRSQGASDKAPVGYGPREGDDVAALVDNLRAAHRLPSPLYLMGASYGGTTAMFAASELTDVRGVIALEPYDNAADVIRRAPSSGLFAPKWVGSVVGRASVDAGIVRASRDLGVDLAHIDTASALSHAPCTLILRGGNDNLVSAASLKALADRAPAAHYVEVSGENHIGLPLRTDRLMPPLLQWMADTNNGTCVAISPLPGTLSATAGKPQGTTGGT